MDQVVTPGCIVELLDGRFFRTQSVLNGGHAVFVPGDGWVPFKQVVARPTAEGSRDFIVPAYPTQGKTS